VKQKIAAECIRRDFFALQKGLQTEMVSNIGDVLFCPIWHLFLNARIGANVYRCNMAFGEPSADFRNTSETY